MTDQPRKDWHVERKLTIGHLASTVVLIIMISAGYTQFESRLVQLETQVKSNQERNTEFRREIRKALNGLDDKVDRMLELLLRSDNGR